MLQRMLRNATASPNLLAPHGAGGGMMGRMIDRTPRSVPPPHGQGPAAGSPADRPPLHPDISYEDLVRLLQEMYGR